MSESVREVIKSFLDKGYLINPDLIEKAELDRVFLDQNLEKNETGELLVFNDMMLNQLLKKKEEISKEVDKILVGDLNKKENINVKVIKSFNKYPKNFGVQDFVIHYHKRYEKLRGLLQSRSEFFSPLSISRIISKKTKDNVAIIGLVYEKNYTKNNNLILKVEDNTGSISVLISNSKKDLFEKGKDIVLDEVLGIRGTNGDKIIFADDIFFPDIPYNNPIKKGNKEEYTAIISDMHVGSELFLEEDFMKFVNWINVETGTEEQKAIARKTKYLFIVGDLVDGVGIYPNQNSEQNIQDIKLQYGRVSELLKMIREDVNIVLCPGNHDAVRLSEPQPCLDRDLASSLYNMKNVTLVSNPSVVNIASNEGFEGFDFLLYHGYSYDTYSESVESIRFSGATISERTNMVMKFLLQKRHLAPTHGSTLFIPDPDSDDLVIDKVPDFFISGHIHKADVTQYGKVTKVSGSCWQSITPFQIKVGHNPDPGKVPIINLKTRETKILKFSE